MSEYGVQVRWPMGLDRSVLPSRRGESRGGQLRVVGTRVAPCIAPPPPPRPSVCHTQVFDLRGGQLLQLLRQGHYGAVNCCEYSGLDQELFTGGDDGQILAWSPAKGDAAGEGAPPSTGPAKGTVRT